MTDPWRPQLEALGGFIRAQRRLANLSLRELASLTNVSNAYLSQIERGLHQPSVSVLRSIARALELSAETMLSQAGFFEEQARGEEARAPTGVEQAIRLDPRLSDVQKQTLLAVYRSYVGAGPAGAEPPAPDAGVPPSAADV